MYGPNLKADKIEFMCELAEVRELQSGPWLLVGDFNLFVNPEDKNNTLINWRMISRFRSRLNRLELKEIYLNGRRYTWSNERARATLEKIDHIFATNSWEDLYPSCFLTTLRSAVSDHCPLLLDLHADFSFGKRFKFESFWTKAPGFMQTVQEAWQSCPSDGNPFTVLNNKLRVIARRVQTWIPSGSGT
ncbi:uncharacterized protein [Aegilops tauschii subsp. strangulata]|uniref:uncharacterized protein n=1 Tax=Aegilops tauschii subsp. strangulata TaxID=200361 RepID=UPI003CC89993